MAPLIWIAALGLGAFAMLNTKTKPLPKDVPADASAWLASVLAPSMTNLSQLQDFWNRFLAGAANQATMGREDSSVRLTLYALVTQLKAMMLAKGASPNADELLVIAGAPAAGMRGIMQTDEAGADVQQAAADALVDQYTDVAGIGQYIAAMVQRWTATKNLSAAQQARLRAYMLAMKAKQMSLANPLGWTGRIPEEAYFAIANLPANALGNAGSSPNSIFRYQ